MQIPLYIAKRVLISIPTIVLVSIIGFLLMRSDINPIDPLAELKLNPSITAEVYQQERERLGIDRPLPEQYGRWVSHIFQFDMEALREGRLHEFFTPDLGTTFNGEDVASLLMQRSGNTLLLNFMVIALTWLIALPIGVYAALKWRSVTDRLMTLVSSIGMATPSFVLAILLAVLAVKTRWLPVGGIVSDNFARLGFFGQIWDVASHLILPVLTLTLLGISGLQRQMRGNLLDVLEAEYVRVARAKGLPEHVVIYKHAVRTAINPLITMLGYEFSSLLSRVVTGGDGL